MSSETLSIVDRRSVAAYDAVDAARYARMPKSTLRAWFLGQAKFERVLVPASTTPLMLSFFNLAEAHVLNAIRRRHEVPLKQVRAALQTLAERYPSTKYPLISRAFLTDGVDLFVEEFGEIVNISRGERQHLQHVLESHVRRIDFSTGDLPVRLFPFSSASFDESERRSIVIDPNIAFGRRVIFGTGIRTEIVAERYAAGERMEDLADDYGRTLDEIEDAIRSEFSIAA